MKFSFQFTPTIFKTPLPFLLFLLTTLHITQVTSQSISITSPEPNQPLPANSQILITLDSSDGLTGFQDVSVAIGLLTCTSATTGSGSGSGCANSSTPMIGTVLYSGEFSPQRVDPSQPAYQNFTLTIPSTIQPGLALLTVSHFYLIGAGMEPILENKNQSVSIVSSS